MDCLESVYGGEGGIRTPGTVPRTPVFKTGAFNHSATSPLLQFYYSSGIVPERTAKRPFIFHRLHRTELSVQWFSRPEPSTTRPPLRILQFYYSPRISGPPSRNSIHLNSIVYKRAPEPVQWFSRPFQPLTHPSVRTAANAALALVYNSERRQ